MTGSGTAIRVLIVDPATSDNTGCVGALRAGPDTFGVDTVDSASAALDRLLAEPYDCVVSAYDLPDGNGIELMRDIRGEVGSLPFILYPQPSDPSIYREAAEADVTETLPRPPSGTEDALLAERIVRAVGGGAAQEDGSVRFRRLIEESSDVIAIVDPDGRFEYLSPFSEQVLGYDPSELIGESGFDYIHPDDLELVQTAFESLGSNPAARPRVEFRFDHPPRGWRWVEARGRNLLDDRVIEGLVVYVRDVTERKRIETDLRRVRDRMEFALDATDSVIYEIDVDTGDETRHGPFERLYGVPESEAPDTESFYELAVHPDDRATVVSTQQDIFEGTTDVIDFEYRTNPDTGPVRWIHTRGYVLEDDPDGGRKLIGLATDITSLKEREAELEWHNERLDQLASMVSHDLRNPLNVAMGRLALAKEEPDADHFQAIEQALDRMEALIEDLLPLARTGGGSPNREPVDLASTLERCWATVETGSASLEIEVDMTVQADASRLRQLFENLFRNAVEHGGQTVTVRVGTLDDGFFVEDHGPGISPADRKSVFDVGFSTRDGGTGLGLAIVKQVAIEHGWEVRLTESETGGARFEVTGVEPVG